jgi:hypothetical protein
MHITVVHASTQLWRFVPGLVVDIIRPSLLVAADALIKFIPTFAAAMVLWLSMTRATSPWALPITLAAVPAAFHVYLLATGTTLADAQDAGWVLKPEVRGFGVWLPFGS